MGKKFDVGIVGLWGSSNYGSVATYYALSKLIESLGYSVAMIERPVMPDEKPIQRNLHSFRFAKEHYNLSPVYKYNELNKLNDFCDAFVIGSDQVWNYSISKKTNKYYYLDFANDNKTKVSYAASFGHSMDFAPYQERKNISGCMKKFDGISVREDDGVRLCRDCYSVNAKRVLDPVFAADPDIYTPLIEKSKVKETEPYILTYILDPTPQKREALLYISKKLGGMKIINILDGLPWKFEKNKKLLNLDNCPENIEVEEWLYYFKNAEFVVTDSCHGTSFALVFQKKFIAITNSERGLSRFQSLASLFDFSDRLVTDINRIYTDDILFESPDYSNIDKIMQSERKQSIEWLDNALNKRLPSVDATGYADTLSDSLSAKFLSSFEGISDIQSKEIWTVIEKLGEIFEDEMFRRNNILLHYGAATLEIPHGMKSEEIESVLNALNNSYSKPDGSSPLENQSFISSTKIKAGSSATLIAAATGGKGSYMCASYFKKVTDKNWITINDFGSVMVETLTPTQAGTYNVCIKVRDENQAISKKYFKLQVIE